MAGKPITSDKVLKDILSALVEADVVPYNEMVSSLAKATKKNEDMIGIMYTDRYRQIKEADTDPFVPPGPVVG